MLRQLVDRLADILRQITGHYFALYVMSIILEHHFVLIDRNGRLRSPEFVNANVGHDPLNPCFELGLLFIGTNFGIHSDECFL
ncbi:hypothetical protein D3C81_2056140 [compost metagenome]